MILIYIHGFNSGYHPGGYKIASLQKMATVHGVSYDSFSMHDEVQRSLRQQLGTMLEKIRTGEPAEDRKHRESHDRIEIREGGEGRNSQEDQNSWKDRDSRNGRKVRGSRDVIALVGTSLGAYWAARFGNHFGIPAVLINPTIHPHQSLKRYVGHKLLNFVTRSRNILRDEVPASYGDIERSGDFLVLLDKGDELLDYRLAEKWFDPETARREQCCKVVTFEGGSHRFSHMEEALPHIRQFLSKDYPSQQNPSGRLFARENLVAWCIIPYDNQDRTPLQRAGMLRELGFTRMGYDWRERHLPHFVEEIRTLQKFEIELTSVWFWVDDRASDGLLPEHYRIFDAIEDAGLSTSIWVGLHENVCAGLQDAQKVEKVAGIVDRIHERARKSGSRVALYNHGGWAGVPENQVRIIQASKYDDIGIVFNFHHGHDQIDRFAEVLEILMPWLETVNLNGMEKDGAHIIDIGEGDHEKNMIKTLMESGFSGNIGIIGHTEGEDVRDVLLRNLNGLEKILEELQR